ncbi:MAG: HlyD family efflux transporter periplasmic adaptor subunit [Candidatus Omnitrophica bacterium]|nr:HlyD family efflux transporter periplasmic adaptor subunit [Candidatus Omnitrophota bacterium]
MKRSTVFILSLLFLAGCKALDNGTSLKFSGTLEWTEYALGARGSGRLAELNVEEGQAVKKDQMIATFDRFKQARRDLERAKQLYEQGGTTEQELEHAALAEDDQKIVSPLDGIVLVKVNELGEVVQAGAPVVVIGDPQDMWVRIFVPEGTINRIKMGQSAEIRFDGISEKFVGHVSFITPQAEFTPRNVQTQEERVTQTFAVKVRLNSPVVYLRPGVAADVYFDTKG